MTHTVGRASQSSSNSGTHTGPIYDNQHVTRASRESAYTPVIITSPAPIPRWALRLRSACSQPLGPVCTATAFTFPRSAPLSLSQLASRPKDGSSTCASLVVCGSAVCPATCSSNTSTVVGALPLNTHGMSLQPWYELTTQTSVPPYPSSCTAHGGSRAPARPC